MSAAKSVLKAQPGDVQALKALIAAESSGGALELQLSSSDVPSNLFGASGIALVLPVDAPTLTEPNAIASYLGGEALAPPGSAHAVSHWLEWEAVTLRPATYAGDLDAALQELSTAVGNKQHLVGKQLTLADVCVYCTLLPLLQLGVLNNAAVEEYLEGIGVQPAVRAAIGKLLDGQHTSVVVKAFEQQVASHKARLPKLPIKGRRNIMITSALPYVNNVPHLGNIIGCVLSADCYARYCRSRGHNCIYVCGTDEYGTATETKALEEGLTCAQVCDKYHAIHADIYKWFDIDFDIFGRTPTRAQTEIVQSIFRDVWERGCCSEQAMEQLYSEALGKFLADRFVVGTCPKCGYEDARGDQCDNCGSLMNPTELLQPRCKLTNTTPIVRTTRHIFLDLPQLSARLQEYITSTSTQGGWSSNCVQVTNAWMRDGLKQRCITRDLKWGIPVPLDGYRDKVFYVWFDAPIGYISITANYTNEWKQWWQSPKDVELVQFMGKDNVPFHTVIFPATLLGSGGDWTLMRSISVTEYLNYESGKFSKSRGVGVFGNDAKDTGIPVEVWRYYLLANRPESQDYDFKWVDLQARNNNELLKNLGNFVNRALVFVVKFFDGVAPAPTAKGLDAVRALGASVSAKLAEYIAALEAQKIREGIRLAMAICADGNKFFTETEPFRVVKVDKEHAATLVAAGVGMARLMTALIWPYMPSLTDKILQQLALPPSDARLTDELISAAASPHLLVPGGHKIGTPSPLISELRDDVIEGLRQRFSGSQSERAAADAAAAAASSSSSGTANGPAAKGAGKAAASKGGAGKAGVDGKASGDAKAAAKAGPKGADGKAGAPAAAAAAAAAASSTSSTSTATGADANGPPVAKSKGGGGKKGGAEERSADFSRLDVRVGVINKAWRHPDAESLYVEEVDVGEGAPRQVVSGLVKYVPIEEMQGRRILVVCNMKPANMRGVQSQAMVLAASSPDGAKVELVDPPAAAAVGDRVVVAGVEGEPDEQLNPKKKVFEAVAADLATNGDRVACYKGVPLAVGSGACSVPSIAGGGIR